MNVPGQFHGKVAFITGVARGQGRAHALRLAEEGADIIGLDICAPVDDVDVTPATGEDLAETVQLVESRGRRILARHADVRSQEAVNDVVAQGIDAFGHIESVSANAGTGVIGPLWETSEERWRATLDINLTGAFHTAKAVIPHMIAAERGGSLIFTSSVAGFRALSGMGAYMASKHGVIGIAKNLAADLGRYGIRSNVICPGNTNTPMAIECFETILKPPSADDTDNSWRTQLEETLAASNPMNVALVEAEDQTSALLWLASDASRYVTGQVITIDAGWSVWVK